MAERPIKDMDVCGRPTIHLAFELTVVKDWAPATA
jgi:hypothetical protein